MGYTFRKDEKLRHTRLVETLFNRGGSLYDFPLRAAWLRIDQSELEKSFKAGLPPEIGPVQMLVTVPKRKLRHAVDRVKMRRRIREAYRLNRLPLKTAVAADDNGGTLCLAFIYIADKLLPYALVESKMKRILAKVEKKISITENENGHETHPDSSC